MSEAMTEVIEGYLVHLEKERGYSQNSIKAYGTDLAQFRGFILEYSGEESQGFLQWINWPSNIILVIWWRKDLRRKQ